MSDDELIVDIGSWIEKARQDPLKYFERQVTEIILNAIGSIPELAQSIFLKGGALMGVVYNSPRSTADLDFTTSFKATDEIDTKIQELLNAGLIRAAAHLGYADVVSRVQSMGKRPSKRNFQEANFPALQIKVGYAQRGTPQEDALDKGHAARVIELDISFNEPVEELQTIKLKGGADIQAYSLLELIGEKLRALLQQETRNRYRRQDVYDIDLLLSMFVLDDDEKRQLLAIFREKSLSRNINPNVGSLSNPEIRRRSKAEWDTLALELGELPSFDECYDRVEKFYRLLPW